MNNFSVISRWVVLIFVLMVSVSLAESLPNSVRIAVEAEDLVPVYGSTKLQIRPDCE